MRSRIKIFLLLALMTVMLSACTSLPTNVDELFAPLDNEGERVTVPDYTGVMIPDEFVVGYGLDYSEQYRALPYIGVLKPEVYTK